MPHNFNDSLAKSHAAVDLPLWDVVYKQAFPYMIAFHDHREDGQHQRSGIDRSVILDNSKQILIDEKARYKNKNGKIYSDIALEYLSNEERCIAGWVCKPLLADYIAYAILPLGKAYLMPVIQLQLAWKRYGEQWKLDYPFKIKAYNENYGIKYTTISVGIPVAVLFKAIGDCLRVNFTPLMGET